MLLVKSYMSVLFTEILLNLLCSQLLNSTVGDDQQKN